MNANSNISSTGRPNSRRREVFIFSPLNFAHWGGRFMMRRQRQMKQGKITYIQKNF